MQGDRQQQLNEICVHARQGWLLSVRVGDELTRNSDFFPFSGAFLPGRIERWRSGTANAHDVLLTGLIGMDGRVYDLKPVDQVRPDLNEEAMKLVATRPTYTPATCRGQPAAWGTTFTVHFKGR